MLITKTHPVCTINEGGMLLHLWLGLNKTVTYAKISPKMMNYRDVSRKAAEKGKGRRQNAIFTSNFT